MTLTMTSPTGGSRIGPGINVVVHTDLVGPFANNDFITVLVNPSTDNTNELCRGVAVHDGFLNTVPLTLGMFNHIPSPGNGLDYGVADASLVKVQLFWQHANGTPVDSGTPATTWIWDPTSGAHQLIGYLTQSGGNPLLAQILAAVSFNKSTPGQSIP